MARAVFTTKLSAAYDDVPEEFYHFPRTYLRTVESTVGDTIIYYEPRRASADLSSRGGRQSYFAIAQVKDIKPDQKAEGLFYALIDSPTYLSFDTPVPFRGPGGTYETQLTREDGGTSKGAFGRAVRSISETEFQAIVSAGFREDPWDTSPPAEPAIQPGPGVQEEPAAFLRPMVEQTSLRPFRDIAFRRAVRRAYDNRCALTGLALVNGGGRPEVQAAHIKPVAHAGPDSIRNGLALSGTMHWLFDRGLITVDEGWKIHLAEEAVPAPVRGLLNPDGGLRVPADSSDWPHPLFLKHHREVVAAGKAWLG